MGARSMKKHNGHVMVYLRVRNGFFPFKACVSDNAMQRKRSQADSGKLSSEGSPGSTWQHPAATNATTPKISRSMAACAPKFRCGCRDGPRKPLNQKGSPFRCHMDVLNPD